MKKVLIIGAGAMGTAFSFPLLDNNHKVTLTEPYNTKLTNQLLKKKKFHPSLKIILPKKLLIKKFSSQLLLEKLTNAKGQIFNISSMGGVNFSSKFPGLSLYSSSKAAISILTECLSEELKDLNVRVNAFALGSVQTEMLEKAFPGYESGISSQEMALFIVNFISSSKNFLALGSTGVNLISLISIV